MQVWAICRPWAFLAASFAGCLALRAQGQLDPGLVTTALPQATPRANAADFRTGVFQGFPVTYEVRDGLAIYQGDIILGPEASLVGPLEPSKVKQKSVTVASPSSLWTFEKIAGAYAVPYTVVTDNPNRAQAITNFNSIFAGIIQFVPRTTETSYVQFNFNAGDTSGSCASSIGLFAPAFQPNTITGSVSCGVDTLMHEMGHTIGLYHEQSRSDRDQFVTVNYQNVSVGLRYNFDIALGNAQLSGGYDYASIMHYFSGLFTRNGRNTIDAIPAGIPLTLTTYSAGDIDAIKRLYGAAPTQVTIATNPPGLQVTIDGGAAVTTPVTVNWAIGSQHTLNVPAGLQVSGGINHQFGRWGGQAWSGAAQSSYPITVSAGIGTASNPVNAPATTVYTANFVRLYQFSPGTFGASGTVTASPAPLTIGGNQYLVANQPVTFTASAAGTPGFVFLNWCCTWTGIFPFRENPVTTTGYLNGDFQAQYTNNTPLTTITASPLDRGIGVVVDGGFNYAPAVLTGTTWSGLASHTLSVATPQSPYSGDTRYNFTQWNDAVTSASRTVSSAAGVNFTANFTSQYRLTRVANPSCGGTVTPSLTSADGFYNGGTALNISQVTNPGWVFTGWQYDLSGTTSSQPLTMNDESLVQANFNTVNTPLAITALAPGYVVQNSAPLLTVRGTGFDPANTQSFIGGNFRAVTVINSTTLTIQLTAADTAALGGLSIFIRNYPLAQTFVCEVDTATSLFVATPSSIPSPAVVSLTPVNGTGNATFTATVSDPLGFKDLSVVYLLFNTTVSWPNACLVAYDAYDNWLLLFNDQGTALVPGTLTPGGTGTLSNTRCQISAAGASFSGAGNTLSVSVPITFLGGFVGTNNAYIYAVSLEQLASGYQLQGTWTGNPDVAPTIPPNQFSGTGSPHTFNFQFNDTTSAQNIGLVYVVFGQQLTLSNQCIVAYSSGANTIYLLNNAGTGIAGAVLPGSASTATNGQCTIASGGAVTLVGSTMTLPVTVTFGATFGGLKGAWGYALSSGGSASGWVNIGSWSGAANVAPGTVTAPAPTGSGSGPYIFQITYNDANGYLDLADTFLLVNSTLSGVNACEVIYAPAYNLAFLLNDAATGFVSGSVTLGGAGTVSNTHCSVSSGGVVSGSGASLTVPLQITFTSFSGTKTFFGYSLDASTANSNWQTLGTLTLP